MKRILLLVVCLLLVQAGAFAQSEAGINVFGYYQAQFDQSKTVGLDAKTYNTFGLQQMNLMLGKDLSQSFSSFISLQFTTNYASNRNWGAFSLEEAWVKYRGSDFFNVKTGLLVPTFNNLNEIKTKTPLLPYIFRPLVYESPLADLVTTTNFVPERAFIQIYGALPVGSAKLDYAVYTGNDQPDFISTMSKSTYLAGQDTSLFKMLGGRIGLRVGSLKLGISGTYDHTNPGSPNALPVYFQGTSAYVAASMIGSVVRARFGADVSFQVSGFSFEGEYIGVTHSLTDKQQATLNMLPLVTGGALYNDLNKVFYYGTVSFDFNEQWYAFASYGRLQDNFNKVFHSAMTNHGIGGGYRPLNSVVIKAQYGKYEMIDRAVADFAMDRCSVAVSVFF